MTKSSPSPKQARILQTIRDLASPRIPFGVRIVSLSFVSPKIIEVELEHGETQDEDSRRFTSGTIAKIAEQIAWMAQDLASDHE